MKAHRMLKLLASRYAVLEGPVRRQLDAQTLLKMVEHLDEESSRVYLERFVSKWRVDLMELSAAEYERAVEGVAVAPPRVGLIRRRPMTDLERLVQDELSQDVVVREQQDTGSEVLVTFEDQDGHVHAL